MKVLSLAALGAAALLNSVSLGAQIITVLTPPPGPLTVTSGELGDAALLAQLNPMLQGVQVVSPAGSMLDPVSAPVKLGLALPTGNSTITQIVNQPVNLQVLLKGFLFTDEDLARSEPRSALPVFDLSFLTKPAEADKIRLDSVPGYLGTITGMLPLPSVITPKISANWSVLDEKGNEVPSARLLTPDGKTGTSFTFQVLPPLTELVSDLKPVNYIVRAKVRLMLGEGFCIPALAHQVTCTAVQAIEFKVPVQKIGIPTIAVFFENKNLEGRALIVVPNSSPIPLDDVDSLIAVLRTVDATISNLRTVAKFAPLLPDLGSLDNVIDEVQGATATRFRKANSIDHFTKISMKSGTDLGFGDDDADDYFDSLLFVGTTRRLGCYSEPEQNTSRPRFSVSVPSDLSHIIVLVNQLADWEPDSIPANRVNVLEHEDGNGVSFFANSLSSMKFYFPD